MVIVINANDIEKNKIRGDLGITYDRDVIRLLDVFRGWGCTFPAWCCPGLRASLRPWPSRPGWRAWG